MGVDPLVRSVGRCAATPTLPTCRDIELWQVMAALVDFRASGVKDQRYAKKRKLLESEGVEFDMNGKIKSTFMLSEILCEKELLHKEKNSAEVKKLPSKRQKTSGETSNKNDAKKAVKNERESNDAATSSSSGPTMSEIRDVALAMVDERGIGKTC
mmetsp:Transcript_27532/g.41659  ORF Transcript_27532/g.41659 Transcript_27532/m.41659 type:complete len:156 (+) Transcript_27532:424-891(+)